MYGKWLARYLIVGVLAFGVMTFAPNANIQQSGVTVSTEAQAQYRRGERRRSERRRGGGVGFGITIDLGKIFSGPKKKKRKAKKRRRKPEKRKARRKPEKKREKKVVEEIPELPIMKFTAVTAVAGWKKEYEGCEYDVLIGWVIVKEDSEGKYCIWMGGECAEKNSSKKGGKCTCNPGFDEKTYPNCKPHGWKDPVPGQQAGKQPSEKPSKEWVDFMKELSKKQFEMKKTMLTKKLQMEYPHFLPAFVVEIKRLHESERCTSGELYVDGVKIGYVLEPPWRDNEEDISSVPAGAYRGFVRTDPGSTENRIWRIQLADVRNERTNVQIHISPNDQDIVVAPWITKPFTKGCALIGTELGPDKCTIPEGHAHPAYHKLREAFRGPRDSLDPDPIRSIIVVISGEEHRMVYPKELKKHDPKPRGLKIVEPPVPKVEKKKKILTETPRKEPPTEDPWDDDYKKRRPKLLPLPPGPPGVPKGLPTPGAGGIPGRI